MIKITNRLTIDDSEVEEMFVRSSGTGGQNVNKVSTAVQLRFDVGRPPSLPDAVRSPGASRRRLTQDHTAQRYRTQERNRRDALDRLIELIRRATLVPASRKPTVPTAPLNPGCIKRTSCAAGHP